MAEAEAGEEPEPGSRQKSLTEEEELGRLVHWRKQASIYQQTPRLFCLLSEGGKTWSAISVPGRDHGTEEREAEPRHLLSQKQTLPSEELEREEQAELEEHDEAEKR